MAYRRTSRDLDDDLAYGETPPNRWDRDRFERARYEDDLRFERAAAAPPPRRAEIIVEDRPRGRFDERREYDEPRFASRIRREIYDDGPAYPEYALEPYQPRPELEREVFIERRREPAAPRPGLLRRQSSLDTFDRRPARHAREIVQYQPRSPPRFVGEREDVRIDIEDSRRPAVYREQEIDFVRRPSVPRVVEPPRRERVRETEIIREEIPVQARPRARSDVRSRHSAARSRASSSSSSAAPAPVQKIGKRGHTKLPKAQFTESAIRKLGVPLTDDDNFFIVGRALDKDSIDQLLEWSREAPREPRVTQYKFDGDRIVSGGSGTRYEKISTEWINPPTVRGASPAPSARAPVPVVASPPPTQMPAAPMPPPPAPVPVHESIEVTQQQSGAGPLAPQPPIFVNAPAQPQLFAPAQYAPQQPQLFQPSYAVPQTTSLTVQQRYERSREDIEEEIRRLQFEKDIVRLERQGMPGQPQLFFGQPQQQFIDYRPSGSGGGMQTFKPDRRRRSSSPGRGLRIEPEKKPKKPNPKLVSAMLATLT